jgi:membrane protein DedA with SNARE-associated domain
MAPHEWLTHYGAPGLFVLLVLGIFGLPVPDEALLSLSGFLIREGQLRPATVVVAAVLGSFCGITVSFLLGESVGLALVRLLGRRARLTPDKMERFHQLYDRFGQWSLTFGYFIPGFRHFVAIAAGMSRMRYRDFAIFAYSGALIWVATFLTAGYWLGREWKYAEHLHGRIVPLAVFALGVVVATYLATRSARGRNGRNKQADTTR